MCCSSISRSDNCPAFVVGTVGVAIGITLLVLGILGTTHTIPMRSITKIAFYFFGVKSIAAAMFVFAEMRC